MSVKAVLQTVHKDGCHMSASTQCTQVRQNVSLLGTVMLENGATFGPESEQPNTFCVA